MIKHFENRNLKRYTKTNEVIEKVDEEAMERNRLRLAEALTGIKAETNIDISLTEKYDKETQRQLNDAFDDTLDKLRKNPEWFLND